MRMAVLTINVEQIPHPIAAPATQYDGGNNFEVIVAGTWQIIWEVIDQN